MTAKRGGLGKGLDSLIKENKTAKHTAPVKKEVVNAGPIMMKINDVEPNRDQPRKHFEEDALLELADSIKQFGILQPLIVQKRNDYYEIIAGVQQSRPVSKRFLLSLKNTQIRKSLRFLLLKIFSAKI